MEKGHTITDINALIIGGSAGSLEVLLTVIPELRVDLSFAIIVVLHRKTGTDNLLSDLFSGKTNLPVHEIEEKQQILPGNIYIAPADYHLLIENDRMFSLDFSEKVNFSRPSIDVAFQSASEVYKKNLAALLLSGANSDGVQGLQEVLLNQGLVLIQDPLTASVAYMPAQASVRVKYHDILKPEEMGNYINALSKKSIE